MKKSNLIKALWVYAVAFILLTLGLQNQSKGQAAKDSSAAPAVVESAKKTEDDKKPKGKKEKSTKQDEQKGNESKNQAKKGTEMFAEFETSKGKFKAKLFKDKTPKTVENFAGLANGTKEWTDPKTRAKVKKPFYDGLAFHRVIPDFMIQGGCPRGDGTGDPGYRFDDEIVADLKHTKPGLLSMANAGKTPDGKGTNGSQFFVTVAATPWLDGNHTVFGEIIEGMDVVNAISTAPRDMRDKPKEAITIKSVKITEN